MGLRSLFAFWLGGAGKSGPPEALPIITGTGQVSLPTLTASGNTTGLLRIDSEGAATLPPLISAGTGQFQQGVIAPPVAYVYRDIRVRSTRLRGTSGSRLRSVRSTRVRHVQAERAKA